MRVVKKSFNQNYLIRKTLIGTLALTIFFWTFALLYKPFEFDYNTRFNFALSLFLICLSGSLSFLGFISLLKVVIPSYFEKKNWTLFKEIKIVLLCLVIIGITIYAFGYVVNIKQPPVRLAGILDAIKMAFLIGIIPFAIFTVKNIGNPYITTYDVIGEHALSSNSIIEIQSALKEKLQISVEDLIYIASCGNYIDFYLLENNTIKQKTIRNSLNDIEKQLVDFPFCIRTHRAFIVNMNFILDKKGNAQGYRLKLKGISDEIPVSRKKITEFDSAFKKSQN
ncbi:MAG: LytTR family transcriptional regulator [Bacteroidales bacterium]|nr:LytTR family transcriptional regulator [Bacteroidales bacterium]